MALSEVEVEVGRWGVYQLNPPSYLFGSTSQSINLVVCVPLYNRRVRSRCVCIKYKRFLSSWGSKGGERQWNLVRGRERKKRKGCSVVEEGDWRYHAHHVRVDEVSTVMPRSLQGSKTPF